MTDRLAQDLRYIRDWSLGMDFAIILRTVPLLLHDINAY
jgi:lipopolysaccharide/colanic/teichoic acid biosynthesis glycosyltransferase